MTLQILVAVVVLISAGAEKATSSTCQAKDPKLCFVINSIRRVNQDALKSLEGKLDGKGKERLIRADQLVVAVLKKSNPAEQLPILEEALKVEVDALDIFRKSSDVSISEGTTIRTVSGDIEYAIENLIDVIVEVETDKTKKDQTEKLYREFVNRKVDISLEDYSNEVHDLGHKILNIL
ncbi:hypothetical protein Q1695_009047 [Nippostrongylus brasiliensis]|nr:hypothetical protein Q1695_009047 [Nippostrongylus brasiliensis]